MATPPKAPTKADKPAADEPTGKHAAPELDPVDQASAVPAGVVTPVEDTVVGG